MLTNYPLPPFPVRPGKEAFHVHPTQITSGGRTETLLNKPMRRNQNMLYTIAVVLIILWLLGFVSSYTIGGFIHILLVIALVLFIVRLISGRKVL